MERDTRYLEYYRKRAQHERKAAAEAPDDQVRAVHFDMAKRYAKMVKKLEAAD
jgi:hypothetical protein